MAISSLGIGSGLNVSDIITKLVALEKQPIEGLKARAENIKTQVSTYAQIKSLSSTLADAASKLTRDAGWNGLKIDSSNPAVSMTVSGLAQPATYDIGVTQLARAQAMVSDTIPTGSKLNLTGTLKITPTNGAAVDVSYDAADTLDALAARINDQVGSVTATVMRDASGERLMLRAKNTGTDAGFTTSGLNFTESQSAQNARITINGVSQESATNTFDNLLPGLKLSVNKVTTEDAQVAVTNDKEGTKKNIQEFVDAYNALNTLLSDSTKYDATNKTAGILQGDSGTVSLQNSLRMLTMGKAGNASGAFKHLSDIGIQMREGGGLTVNTEKLDKALSDSPDAIKSLFAAKASGDGSGGGLAVNFKAFTDKLLAFDGTLNSKTDSLQKRIDNNLVDQRKVNERASIVEARLSRQYSALDKQMAGLQTLSSYMQQQVSSWNNNKQ